jgi:HEPN domain-containing protein
MPLEKLIEEWLDLGNQDLQSAAFLLDMRPIPLEVIGFHCQQALEKYLKAFLIKQNNEPDKTHDLMFLLQRCIDYDSAFAAITEHCAVLTEYSVKTRYPYPGKIDESTVKKGIELASEAITFIKNKITK